jgi:hypothetical protein
METSPVMGERDSENACTLFKANEDDLHASINQGGFLEASSTDPSHQEQLDASQEVDQGSQFEVEVNKPCVVPFLINADDYFEILEQHAYCINLKLMRKWDTKEEALEPMAKVLWIPSRQLFGLDMLR